MSRNDVIGQFKKYTEVIGCEIWQDFQIVNRSKNYELYLLIQKIEKTVPAHMVFKMILFSTCNKRDNKKHNIRFEIIEQMEQVDRNAFPFSQITLRKLYIFSFQDITAKYALQRSLRFWISACEKIFLWVWIDFFLSMVVSTCSYIYSYFLFF